MYKQFSLNGLRLALATAALATLAACGTVSQVDDAGKTDQPVFPQMSDASMPEGYYVNQENLGMIRPGMTKKQVQALIGHPQFSEGMFGVREWDYIFKFRQAEGQPDKVCQYKVLFDKDRLAQSFYFKPTDCVTPAQPVVEAQEPKVKKVELSADATFDFASAVLRPRGRAELDKLVRDLDQVTLTRIDIVGHTDRLGGSSYNDALSIKRADAVRDYLVQRGVKESQISSSGRGADEPLVNCPGPKSAQLIKCLAPNRRTTITIHAE